ncbi:MAG: glycosyltransferase, partial [bacterium]|nr:glycosyltransferase [bacterium]
DNGQADAINKGMKMAKGEIVAYLNSDDTCEPDTFSLVSRFFRENPERIWVSGRCNLIDENDSPTRGFIKKYREFWANLKLPFIFFLINFIAQPATFWKREAFEKIGFFDTSTSLSVNPEQPYNNRPQCLPLGRRRVDESLYYAFDYDFWLRLAKLQPPVVMDKTLANFRVHPSSKGKTGLEKQFLEDFRVVSRHTRNPLFLFCHFLSNLSLVLAYNLLRWVK